MAPPSSPMSYCFLVVSNPFLVYLNYIMVPDIPNYFLWIGFFPWPILLCFSSFDHTLLFWLWTCGSFIEIMERSRDVAESGRCCLWRMNRECAARILMEMWEREGREREGLIYN